MLRRGAADAASPLSTPIARFTDSSLPIGSCTVLELEHEEDLARLGGFLSGASAARTASVEAVAQRLWHRLPWLGLGLLGAMASAVVVGAFEEEIQTQVLLAFFLPAVVYMADAVGTQTETVVIRGMALGVPIRTVFARELMTGLVIGVLLGAAFFVFSWVVWGNGRVAGDGRHLTGDQLLDRIGRRDGAAVRIGTARS